jgi:hypothetical protein
MTISKGDFKKDNLHEIIKKLKMDNSNKKDVEKAILHRDEVLKHLKTIDGHIVVSLLKRY